MIEKQPSEPTTVISTNIANVRATIAAAAHRVGRDPSEITLVAVSKTKPLELIQMAYELGVTSFGENKVQEAIGKIQTFHPPALHWHMIGHLQSNKAQKVVGTFACIHSVDSLHIAQTINRHAEKLSQTTGKPLRQPVLLQVNVSGEMSKEGMTVPQTPDLARQIVALPYLDVQGLMTVAPLVDDAEKVRPVFSALRELRERLRQEVPASSWAHLSMGMTDDYPVAIEEGATIVRVGRAIFGERAYKGVTL